MCKTRKFVMATLHWKQGLLCDKNLDVIHWVFNLVHYSGLLRGNPHVNQESKEEKALFSFLSSVGSCSTPNNPLQNGGSNSGLLSYSSSNILTPTSKQKSAFAPVRAGLTNSDTGYGSGTSVSSFGMSGLQTGWAHSFYTVSMHCIFLFVLIVYNVDIYSNFIFITLVH